MTQYSDSRGPNRASTDSRGDLGCPVTHCCMCGTSINRENDCFVGEVTEQPARLAHQGDYPERIVIKCWDCFCRDVAMQLGLPIDGAGARP